MITIPSQTIPGVEVITTYHTLTEGLKTIVWVGSFGVDLVQVWATATAGMRVLLTDVEIGYDFSNLHITAWSYSGSIELKYLRSA